MRSTAATLLLAVIALALCGVAGVQLSQSNLHSLFGKPPLPPGSTLFEFDVSKVGRLNITNSAGGTAAFEWEFGHWQMKSPSLDRADYRHLQSLVLASRTLRVQDAIPRDELDLDQAGFKTGHYNIELVDSEGMPIAKYTLGRPTQWHLPVGEKGDLAETFFVAPADRDDVIYVCSGPPARPLLDGGFDLLRDHRPFLFNAKALSEIIIRDKHGELVVSRETLLSPWRVNKPLDLRSNPDAVARLVKGLYDLQAIKVHEPGSVTLPARTTKTPFLEITLNFQDSAGTRAAGPSLVVYPPLTPDTNTVFASVTGRKTIFELPLNPAEGLVALSELPTRIDDLRSRTLSSSDLMAGLKTIAISSPQIPDPLVLSLGKERMSGQPRWLIEYGPGIQPANEPAVFSLITAITIDTVTAIATDAADDLKPYGLDPPAKRVTITGGKDGKSVTELLFGTSGDDRYFAMQSGTATVAEIGYGTWSKITAHPFSWRDSILWPRSLIDLQEFHIERPGEPTLHLTYNFISENWTAAREGKDITPLLNTQRATILLDKLEQIHVSRWLGPDSREARLQLENPTLTIEGIYRTTDNEGNPGPARPTLMDLAPASDSPRNQLYYGRLSGDLDFFVIPKGAYDILNVRLLDE